MLVRAILTSIVLGMAAMVAASQTAWAIDVPGDAHDRSAQAPAGASLSDAADRMAEPPAGLPTVVPTTSGSSYDWSQIAIGALLGIGIVLAGYSLARAVHRGPPLVHH